MLADQRTDRVSAAVAKLRHKDEIKHVKRPIDAGKKINLLNKVQQPWYVHQSKQSYRDRHNAGRVAAGDKLPDAESQYKNAQKTGLEIVHARRRLPDAEFA